MKKIAFSGTLDPITNGHLWVIGEARELADEVVVLISENPFKKPQFDVASRKDIVERSVAAQGWTNVSVVLVRGDYTARAAKRLGIDFLIRGIRNTSDFDYENLIQQANVDVLHGAKTLFVMPPRDLGSVSSSFVRGLQGPVGWHWTTRQFMPAPAYAAWILDWLRKDWDSLWPSDDANAAAWFARLTGESAYGSGARPYHNLDHLVHGLTEITVWAANAGAGAARMAVLKKAFWFHDAVYGGGSGAGSNEEQSAQLWLASGLDGDAVALEVASLIRATEHLAPVASRHALQDVMQGVDLAILGQAADVYDGYARAVRAEYQHVEEADYLAGRERILAHFHAQAVAGTLYPDAYFADLYNERARDNLARELETLRERQSFAGESP
ncbi:pantetheine-phosphate adenylyltransferase [Massilia sp. CCM 8734]|uniref:pantetheine-phosphate adenylyltransferase n=1 Tax=Massilia sp. CCM 8734 TaxID=2609283 RepID=UPI0014211A78|nr:pantetheine-phosphate adenylyltransferase [Massilia sp. CCM 8734]NHZ97860.1 pantetheine-phosphate adenylyltransferase [Massilia sp. CCM 8734]